MSIVCAQETTIGGHLNSGFTFDSERSSFGGANLSLEVSSEIADNISLHTQVDVNGSNTDLKQAFVDFQYNDSITARVGTTIVPFGRQVHSFADTRYAASPTVFTGLIPNQLTDSGAGVHGDLNIGGYDVYYKAFLFNGLKNNGLAANKQTAAADDNNDTKAYSINLGLEPVDGLDVGASFYNAKIDGLDEDSVTLLGVDAGYTFGNYEFLGEYAIQTTDDDTPTEKSNAMYVEARAHVLQDQLASVFTQFDNPVATVFARYGTVDLDADVDDNETKQVTVGVNFRPVETVAYKFEYASQTAGTADADATINGAVSIGF